MKLDGAILAGGLSSRMGRDKGQLCVGGERLVLRQIRLLQTAGADPLWLSLGGDSPEPPDLPRQVEIVRDQVSGCGPMAGLAQVFAAMRHGLVVAVAVDLPRLEADFLRELIARAKPGRGVIPEWQGRLEPLAAIYPRDAQQPLAQCLRSAELGLQRGARTGIRDGWLRLWQLRDQEAAALTNWNRPEDFAES